jgi:Protein of unknown function (DUF3352)
MFRIRVLVAGGLLLTLLPALGAASPRVHAASGIGTAQTDFTRVTPASATLFAAFQPTAADQQPNLNALETAITSLAGFQTGATAKSGANSQAPALLKLVMSGLSAFFNGEIGLAALPVTTATSTSGATVPKLHLMIDAGLRPGVSFGQLGGVLQALGLSSVPSTTYRNVSVSSINLAAVMGMFKAGRAKPILSQDSPLSSTVYIASIGNDLVTATDLPTMQSAIDVSAGAQPSIATNADYQTTFGALPDARVATAYIHVDLGALAQLSAAVHRGQAARGSAVRTGTLSQAFALTAKPDGLLVTASPRVSTGSLATMLALSPLQNASAANLPAGTLFYAALDDPGSLLHAIMSEATAMAQQTAFPIKGLDEVKVLNKLLGLDLDQDIFSWMHGEASIALLPVGSNAFGPSFPASTRLSLVATLKVADPTTVDQKLQQIVAAFQSLSVDPNGLQLGETTGTNGSPERILAATPNGIGYTFNNGYLIAASALPADVAAIAGAGSSSNLSTNPLYQAALTYAGPGPYGAVAFLNLTALRQSFEQIAQDRGANLTRYNQKVKPLLSAFKSLTVVANPGANGGGIAFLGIGN